MLPAGLGFQRSVVQSKPSKTLRPVVLGKRVLSAALPMSDKLRKAKHFNRREAGSTAWFRAHVSSGVTHLFCSSGEAQAMCLPRVQLWKHLE